MAFRKQHMAFIGLLLVLTNPSFAQDSRARIAEIEKQRQEQEGILDNFRADLTEKTVEIEKIKKDSGIVSKLVLQKKMREAQTVSKDLENLVKAHAQLSQELRKERSKLLHEIDDQIQTLTSSKDSRKLDDLKQLQKLIGEKDQILAMQQTELLEIPEFNLSSNANDKDDLIEKLQVVEDLQKNISKKIAFLKDELTEERSKQFLRNEVSHFIDEENFFGEQSFISNGLNRGNNSKNLATIALKKDASSDTPPLSTTPTVPSSATSPSTTTPSGSTSTTATPTTDATSAAITVAAPQTTSESTSFQQPQELSMFKTLLNQVQESIRDTNPKQNSKNKTEGTSVARSNDKYKNTNLNPMEQNLAISQKILNDLNILHQNLNQKIQEIE